MDSTTAARAPRTPALDTPTASDTRDAPVWLASVQRALVATLVLVAARGVLFALKDEYLSAGSYARAARSLARHVVEDGPTVFLPALALAWFAGHLARRRRTALVVLVALAAAVLGYLFTSFRWPADPLYLPTTASPRGRMAHGAAAAAALVAATALVWRGAPLRRGLSAFALLAFAASAVATWLAPGLVHSDRPNLILISLDTLRRDRLGCYGYERPTSPELDRFAARSLRFERAFTPQPWTLTAHMTMLTGLYPSAHDLEEDRSLPFDATTLAERLARGGYDTLAVVDRVSNLDPRYGFARGFGHYQQLPDIAAMKRRRVEELLDDVGGAPFFLFLHFYDAHSDWRHVPYEAAPEDVRALAGRFDPEHPWRDDEGNWASKYLLALQERGAVLEGEELEHLESLYDAGIRSLDRELGRVLADFEQRGLLQSSVILVTADHGEEFFEHGRPMHTQCYDECVGVPFLLHTPDGAVGATDELASLADIAPTFLELAGLPSDRTQGVSLAPLTRGASLDTVREAVVLESRGGFLGLRGRGWSLVPSPEELRLFDVRADPAQAHDILDAPGDASRLPDVRALLERQGASMQALRKRLGAQGEEVELSDAELEQLRALGYAGDG